MDEPEACKTKARIHREWNEAANVFARLSAQLPGNTAAVADMQLHNAVEVARSLVEQLAKDLRLHVRNHRC